MVGTYTELQSRVQTRVIDLPPNVLGEVPQLVNEALFELQTRHNFKCMEEDLYAYTQVNNRFLQNGAPANPIQPGLFNWPGQGTSITNFSLNMGLPGGFKEFQTSSSPTFVRYQDGSLRFIEIAPDRRSIYGTFTEGDSAYPSVILLEPPSTNQNDSTFAVYPLPDGLSDWPDGEYRIQIPCFQYFPNLVQNTDSNWLTLNPHGEHFIIDWATAMAFALDWDTAHQQQFQAMAELSYNRIISADKRFRLSSVNELAIHARGQYQGRIRN